MPSDGETVDNYKRVAEKFNEAVETCKKWGLNLVTITMNMNLKMGKFNFWVLVFFGYRKAEFHLC
jgi:D-arabinose 5-phosphate isomerase GutQ